jgi:8-oxo-dGTP diphosphatase
VRCLDTLTPYAAAAGITVVPDYGLTERGAEIEGGTAERCLAALLDGGDASVLCTHRPVLPRLLEVVEARCDRHSVAVSAVVGEQPLEKGEVLVAHLVRPEHGAARVTAAERHSPH